MEQFEKDQLSNISDNKARVELNGSSADLNIFRFTDSISLNHLAHSDPAMFKRVQDYFSECEKYGFVNISSDGTITPTQKCTDYLSQNKMKDFNIQRITPDNVREVADELKETAGKTTFDSVLNKAETGIGIAGKTVSFASGNSSGTDLAAAGAKAAAQQAAKKAREAAAKKAAAKAAAKTTAKTAAKTAASSTGYGAAVVAAVELTSKGADALTKMDTQAHKVTVHR